MILELYILYSMVALLLFFIGVLYEKALIGKVILVGFSIPFSVATSLSSFVIEKKCCGDTAVLTATMQYGDIFGYFYAFMSMLAGFFVVFYLVLMVGEAGKGK